MRTKITLLLLFLNVVLFAFIFFQREWRVDAADLATRNRVLGPEAADIRRLSLAAAGSVLDLRKEGDRWMIDQPIVWPANDFAVTRILSELQFLEHETSFLVSDLSTNGQSLADYGLSEPRLEVTYFAGDTGTPATLKIGSETAVGNRLYVLSPDGTRIHVVKRSLADSLITNIGQLRSDAIFTVPIFEVRSLGVQNGGAGGLRVRLRRDGGRWMFEAPVVDRAGKTATELLINGLNALRTSRLLETRESADQATGLANAPLQVTLEGNQRRESLMIGAVVPGAKAVNANASVLFARLENRPTVFTVEIPDDILDTLRTAQVALRERRLLDFDPAAVVSLTLRAPGQPDLAIQRLEGDAANNAWQLLARGTTDSAASPIPADPTMIERLLQRLSLLSATSFPNDAPTAADLENMGFNRPERSITLALSASAGGGQRTLDIGMSADGGAVYARSGQQPYIYAIPADTLSAIPVSPLIYRQRLIQQLPDGARIVALKITDLADKTDLLDTRFTEANADAEALRDTLRTIRADLFIRDDMPGELAVAGEIRPWKYRLVATVALTGGDGTQSRSFTLLLTERLGGTTQFAGSPDFNVVFKPEQSLIDAFWKVAYGKRDPGPPAEKESR